MVFTSLLLVNTISISTSGETSDTSAMTATQEAIFSLLSQFIDKCFQRF